jgi:hypothetical protein
MDTARRRWHRGVALVILFAFGLCTDTTDLDEQLRCILQPCQGCAPRGGGLLFIPYPVSRETQSQQDQQRRATLLTFWHLLFASHAVCIAFAPALDLARHARGYGASLESSPHLRAAYLSPKRAIHSTVNANG